MNRKEFLKSVCAGGICSCVGFPLLASEKEIDQKSKKKIEILTERIHFVQKRMARLINILGGKMDSSILNKVLYDLGIECSKEFEAHYSGYKNNLVGFLSMAEKAWGMKYEHDEEKKVIRTFGKKTSKCFCPFVDESEMSSDFCNCSLGWQYHTFSELVGKPVKVKILGSVLRDGESCDFSINYS